MRGEVERRERELKDGGVENSREQIAQEEVRRYRESPAEAVLHEAHWRLVCRRNHTTIK